MPLFFGSRKLKSSAGFFHGNHVSLVGSKWTLRFVGILLLDLSGQISSRHHPSFYPKMVVFFVREMEIPLFQGNLGEGEILLHLARVVDFFGHGFFWSKVRLLGNVWLPILADWSWNQCVQSPSLFFFLWKLWCFKAHPKLGGGFQDFLIFTPTWGNDPIWLYNIFQMMGWNRRIVNIHRFFLGGEKRTWTRHKTAWRLRFWLSKI